MNNSSMKPRPPPINNTFVEKYGDPSLKNNVKAITKKPKTKGLKIMGMLTILLFILITAFSYKGVLSKDKDKYLERSAISRFGGSLGFATLLSAFIYAIGGAMVSGEPFFFLATMGHGFAVILQGLFSLLD